MKTFFNLIGEIILCMALVWFMAFLFFFSGTIKVVGLTITGAILFAICITEKTE